MSFLSGWWKNTTKQEKLIQFIVFWFVFGYSTDINGGMLGGPMCLAWLYIAYDCFKKRSLAGFYMPKKYWRGLVVFLGLIVLASVLLGDKPSIRMAGQYVYWALPFPALFYLGKQADIKYAVFLAVMLSLTAFAVNMMYIDYLLMHGVKHPGFRAGGRIGAFWKLPTTYALLEIGILPILLSSFKDEKLRSNSIVFILQIIVSLLGFWSLWRAGSRGAALGLCMGAIVVGSIVCYRLQIWKTVLVFFLLCSVLISGYAFFGIVPFGHRSRSDSVRLRLLSYSYAMWKDHKLLGVGLANWNEHYRQKYLNDEKEISKTIKSVRDQYVAYYAAKQKKVEPKKLEIRIKKATEAAIKLNADYRMSHNVTLWFFSTTGVLGGIGYIIFFLNYIYLMMKEARKYPENWMIAACLWVFLAINIFGMVDAGITFKGGARLLYIMLGIGLSSTCVARGDSSI